MDLDLAKWIERWFMRHADDGEFSCHVRAHPYSVVGPSNATTSLVYTTKPAFVCKAIETVLVSGKIGLIGRYGLPCEVDLQWIRTLVGTRTLLFLGDMDPVDLMVFAWLRRRCSSHIVYVGVSDSFLAQLGIGANESLTNACQPSEKESLCVLKKVFPDFKDTVGPECCTILEGGRKIELEAIPIGDGIGDITDIDGAD
ncbi:hypothetical protein LCGC14_3105280 [marine sediment metagenome]|uniref:Uncharacterized protein n=1 Tax=marine sediment metagenome TaxID=412755 RepID=A0A0F8W6Q6_9ZZZZ